MGTNTTNNCDESCEGNDDISESVAFVSGAYLVTVGVVSSVLHIMALIKATRVNINIICM